MKKAQRTLLAEQRAVNWILYGVKKSPLLQFIVENPPITVQSQMQRQILEWEANSGGHVIRPRRWEKWGWVFEIKPRDLDSLLSRLETTPHEGWHYRGRWWDGGGGENNRKKLPSLTWAWMECIKYRSGICIVCSKIKQLWYIGICLLLKYKSR